MRTTLKIYRDLRALEVLEDFPPTAVALGLFDGVHLGHRAVIKAAVEQKKNGLTPAVFTFSTHEAIPSSKGNLAYICTDTDRLALLASLGVEIVFMPEFEDIRTQSPHAFIQTMLHKQFRAKYVSCGFNFHFGARGAGDTALLTEQCPHYGITTEVLPEMLLNGKTVSSTEIRSLLQNGAVEQANLLLGEPYFITGEVVHGKTLGRTIGFPTANQLIAPGRTVPRHGVYVSTTEIDGKIYRSVTNIGVKPTVLGQRAPLCETYVIGYEGDLYGKNVKVSFYFFLRPEQKFADLKTLQAQIQLDKQAAQSYLL